MLIFYRDVDVVIRKFMFEVFLKWFEWPEVFLSDRYLRYIYMAFFDSALQLRVLAIQVCDLFYTYCIVCSISYHVFQPLVCSQNYSLLIIPRYELLWTWVPSTSMFSRVYELLCLIHITLFYFSKHSFFLKCLFVWPLC